MVEKENYSTELKIFLESIVDILKKVTKVELLVKKNVIRNQFPLNLKN